jgi:hypothetical protein
MVMRCLFCQRKGRETRVERCPGCNKFWAPAIGVCTWCDYQATSADSRAGLNAAVAVESDVAPAVDTSPRATGSVMAAEVRRAPRAGGGDA